MTESYHDLFAEVAHRADRVIRVPGCILDIRATGAPLTMAQEHLLELRDNAEIGALEDLGEPERTTSLNVDLVSELTEAMRAHAPFGPGPA